MAKKKTGGTTKAASKATKKTKAAQKLERKGQKKSKPRDEDEYDDQDLEGILDRMQKEWEAAHKVTEEVADGPPSRRANAALTACPNGAHLWCIGGEFFTDDKKAYFYNDVFRYSPEKDEWRKFFSPTCPGPRSAHAVVASPVGGGKIFLFGGEFSSLHQSIFHHYGDFWCFDITTHSWDRIETKIRPSARSGHRMALWKNYIILFGGFYDPGITTRYLNDLWIFDIQEYKWRQVEFKENELQPSPRSGFSFLSTPDGIVLHGGYCKEYTKGKRPIGVMLADTWFLKMTLDTPPDADSRKNPADPLIIKWERRKRPSTAYAPSLRSGCTMTAWTAKATGILFGGVTDEDTGEESLESVFWNDLNGYQWMGKGRWVSMTLRRPKKKGGSSSNKMPAVIASVNDGAFESDDEHEEKRGKARTRGELDPEDPDSTIPLPRYNAMLAVIRNTLYIYGGIYERGTREYTLDDFYSIQLDKMDRYVCLKESGVVILDADDESSSDDDDDDEGDDENEDESEKEGPDDDRGQLNKIIEEHGGGEDAEVSDGGAHEQFEADNATESVLLREEQSALRSQAAVFMGVAKDPTRSPEDVFSTPLPGETLAMFYARSREYWAQRAHGTSGNRGKQLRRDAFTLAQERYGEYRPILQEVEKILAEAGLDEEEMRRAATGGMAEASGQSRNRR